jgi:hypothetical protein
MWEIRDSHPNELDISNFMTLFFSLSKKMKAAAASALVWTE